MQTDKYGKTTYRDYLGRLQGSSQTDKYGKTTYRDAAGRTQGSVTTDQYGKTTWRDSSGRIQGSSTTDSFGAQDELLFPECKRMLSDLASDDAVRPIRRIDAGLLLARGHSPASMKSELLENDGLVRCKRESDMVS